MTRERTEKDKIILDIGLKLQHLMNLVPGEFVPDLKDIEQNVIKLCELK